MIYYVRHGETDWNVQGIYCGQTDVELNEKGIEQAKEIKNKLAMINFDIVISSPLKRAMKTAQIIHDGEITTDKRIQERYNGKLEGAVKGAEDINFSDPNESRYDIETLPKFRKRINEFWDDVTEKYKGKNVLVVSHSGVGLYSQAYFKGEPENGDYSLYKIKNCEIVEFYK